MPEFVFCMLMALTEMDEMSVHELAAATGYSLGAEGLGGGHWKAMQRMMEVGLVRKPWKGRWMITERGKIALAIEVGRRTRRLSQGKRAIIQGGLKRFATGVLP